MNIKRLMENRHRTTYVRITALTKDELPIETIEGSVSGGSISVDGTSAVRRTCNLTLISQNTSISEPNWAIKNKFKLEIGILDTTTNNIVWFKQGIYGITSFSLSYSTSGINISIQGKDKMGYLDGTFGGVITAQTDFATWDEIDTEGNIINRDVLIYDIIRNMVHQIGLEPYNNILISGLDAAGYKLWDYRGDREYPIYYFYQWNGTPDEGTIGPVVNMTIDGNLSAGGMALKDIPEEKLYQYALIDTGEVFSYGGSNYKIAKIEHGEAAGYHKTKLTYGGPLVAAPGETVVSVLDKIKNQLGLFEYFYDLDGRFVFQRKSSNVEGMIQPLNKNETVGYNSENKYSYMFEDESLITQISSSPDIGNIKNDIVVWGNKKGISGADIPIHARFAVAHRPIEHTPLQRYEGIYLTYIGKVSAGENEQNYLEQGNIYYKVRRPTSDTTGLVESPLSAGSTGVIYEKKSDGYYPLSHNIYIKNADKKFEQVTLAPGVDLIDDYYILKELELENDVNINNYDWREILYQMALDYFQYGETEDYPKSGFEPFYTDMQAFWRLLYNPECPLSYPQVSSKTADYCNISIGNINSPVDQINGYVLKQVTTNNTANNTTFSYLKPYQSGDSGPIYLLDAGPYKLDDLPVDFRENEISVLKDGDSYPYAYPDITKNSYQYPIKYYKETQEYSDQEYLDKEKKKKNPYRYWNKTALTSPEDLVFWIDFLDTQGPFGEYSIQEIGTRSVVENANDIRSVYQRKTPEVEFVVYPQAIIRDEDDTDQDGSLQLKQLQISPELAESFNTSSQGLSIADKIDELVYKHLCGTTGVNLTTIPLYHLEPNTLIYINSENARVQGDYLINSFTVPLTYNGTMSISVTKVIKRLK